MAEEKTDAFTPFRRWMLLLALAAALALLLWLFPSGDPVEDLSFDAAGVVISTREVAGRVVAIRFRPEDGTIYTVDLSENCRVVEGRGKFSAHRLAGQKVNLRFAPQKAWRQEDQPMAELIFVLPS